MIYSIGAAYISSFFQFGSANLERSSSRTERVGFEKLDDIFGSMKSWFCNTQQSQAWQVLKFLNKIDATVKSNDLIEKFYDLKNLAGDGYRSNFIVTQNTESTIYEITLDNQGGEIFSFSIPLNKRENPPSGYRNLKWTIGASAAAFAVFGYFRPDFRAQVFNNFCNQTYGVVKCSYDENVGWKEFALGFSINEKVADLVGAVGDRFISMGIALKTASNSLRDTNFLFDFAASIPVVATNYAVTIVCWKVQLHVARMSWEGAKNFIFKPDLPGGPPPCGSATSLIVDSAGLYLIGQSVAGARGLVLNALNQPKAGQIDYFSPDMNTDRRLVPISADKESPMAPLA